jgi:hypothetical protein
MKAIRTGKWFINEYKCPKCNHEWIDGWDSMVDDECEECDERAISPHRSEEYHECCAQCGWETNDPDASHTCPNNGDPEENL